MTRFAENLHKCQKSSIVRYRKGLLQQLALTGEKNGMFFDRHIIRLRNFEEYRFALLAGFLGGIFAVLVDLDHIPSAFWPGIYPRLWHIPLFIISCYFAGYYYAHIRGLYAELVLKEKEDMAQFINSLKSMHLNKGTKPIIACVDVLGEKHNNVYDFQRKFFADSAQSGLEDVDYYLNARQTAERNFLSSGDSTYVISTIGTENKFSKKLANCTAVIVAGRDEETGKEISFLSHQDPFHFLKYGKAKFTRDLIWCLSEMKRRCVPGTIDAVIAGGNYFEDGQWAEMNKRYRDDYKKSVALLSEEIKEILGFEPAVITGPKTFDDIEHIYYYTCERRLYLLRPVVGDGSSESYLPRNYPAQEKKWA